MPLTYSHLEVIQYRRDIPLECTLLPSVPSSHETLDRRQEVMSMPIDLSLSFYQPYSSDPLMAP